MKKLIVFRSNSRQVAVGGNGQEGRQLGDTPWLVYYYTVTTITTGIYYYTITILNYYWDQLNYYYYYI